MVPAPIDSLFGTDGIRGRVGEFPFDLVSLARIGCALGQVMAGTRVLIGRDTRQSGPEIEQAISAPLSARASVFSCGIIPTPGLSYIAGHGHFDYAIMITASHNPYTDNGIKILNSRGEKIPAAIEQQIQDIFFSLPDPQNQGKPGKPIREQDKQAYLDFLLKQATGLAGQKHLLVLDCANGATFQVAPQVFHKAGFKVHTIHAAPDGQNINRQCGSTFPDRLKARVIELGAELGIAFDGDGDRVIFVDHRGRLLEGDHTLYAITRYFLATDPHFNPVVVGTVVGNLGLEKALNRLGVTYTRAQVGDKYVYREMETHQAILGGEQSGHTIIKSRQRTGDGILTAIYFLKSLQYFGERAADIFANLTLFPQASRHIPVKEKRDIDHFPELQALIREFNQRHGENSRVLIRYSGTEPKIRIMIESENPVVVDQNLEKFEKLIKSTIGGE